ncbi:unnamed protein product [Closterium sp. NIES-53]
MMLVIKKLGHRWEATSSHLAEAISSQAKKVQGATKLSSTESELVAAVEVGKEGRKLRFLLWELQLLKKGVPTNLYVDNMSAMCLSQAGGLQRRMKHVDHRHMHLQDMVRMKNLELQHIPTTVQPADFFTKRLDRAGLNQCSEAAKLVLHAPNTKAQLGNRLLWDRNESNDVCRSMWQLPALAWHGGGQAGEGPASQGECNAVGGVRVKVSARSGKTDWATVHRRLGHVAMPLLKKLEKDGAEDWLPFVEKQAECMVKRIRTDRGGEFLGAEMMASPKKQGIQRELTTAYTTQSNGVAEWANRTILQIARALLMKSWVGNSMWPHAQQHATVARNSVLTKVSQEMEKITMQLNLTPRMWEEGEEAAAEGGDGEKVQEAPSDGEGGLEVSGSTSGAAGPEGEQPQGKAKAPTLLQRRKPKGVVMKGWETPISRPGTTRLATMKPIAGADVAEQQLGNKEALLILPHGYDPDEEDELAYCFLALAPEDPSSMEEALAGPNREKSLVSRDAEYQSLLENGTWDLVVLPEGKKAVQCKILEEDVYMTQPPGYEDGTGRLCKLKKSIYGLKQAPLCWYHKLAAVLEEMGFRTSSCDERLFVKGEGEKLVMFLVYVDDILLFSSSMKEIQNVQQQLMKNFKCKTFGEVKYYLGIHVESDPNLRWLKLHQDKFITELGEKYRIENERKVATPLPAKFKLVKAAEDEGVEAEEQQQLQSLNPSEEQVDAAERMVKYMNSHPSIGVQYSASAQVKQKGVEVLKEKGERLGEGKLFLTLFTDATWASEKEDSSSVGGYICVVGEGPVCWRSKKQTETALSSLESEYIAMFHGVKEVIWLRWLLEEIGKEQKVATLLFCDSKGALGMAKNAVLHGLNKHMRIKWH